MKIKKLAVLLLAGVFMIHAVPCYAAGKMMVSVSEDDGGPKYSRQPGAQTLKDDVGFSPKIPGSLAGDYQFESGDITESFELDASGAAVNGRKGLSFKYKKSQGNETKSVTLIANQGSDRAFSENADVTEYGGIRLYYTDTQSNYVAWMENDIYYSLMDINKTVSRDELLTMAKGIIDIKEDTADTK